jgi:putative ABC transport system substrate-binding protein
MSVIGSLSSRAPGEATSLMAAFHLGLGETGYVEGQHVTIEHRWPEAHYDRLPALAADLVGRKVDVILTSGGDIASRAAKNATSAIMIVSVFAGEPVVNGLVASLARPGGYLTGVSFLSTELTAKRLELLSELVPQATVIALLVNPNDPNTVSAIREPQSEGSAAPYPEGGALKAKSTPPS